MSPEWLESKNYFNEAKKLIDDIRIDMNKVKISKVDKKAFNNLNKLITSISNNKVKKEDAVEKLKKGMLDLSQLKEKQSTLFQNKMIQVFYQLFNSFGFSKNFISLFSKKESEQAKKNPDEMQKPLWVKINRGEIEELKRNVYPNQDNNDFNIVIDKKPYNLKNAKKYLMEVTKRETTKNEAEKLYKESIQKDINALEQNKSNNPRKYNILDIFNNLDSIFIGTYLHYKDVPKEITFERNIAERSKSRRGKIAEIEREEKNINNKLFEEYFTNHQSPSDMYEKLCETEEKRNDNRVYLIKNVLNKMKKTSKNVPEDNAPKIRTNEKIIDIAKRILYFNQLNQTGQGLKVSTANQMLSRLPISLA